MYHVFSINSFADYTVLICSAGSSKTSITVHTSTGAWVHIHIYVCVCIYILMLVSTSGVGEHGVNRTAMSRKVLPTEKHCWKLVYERCVSPFAIYTPKPLVCSWPSPKHWSIFGQEIPHGQITEKPCNIKWRWQIREAIRKGSWGCTRYFSASFLHMCLWAKSIPILT